MDLVALSEVCQIVGGGTPSKKNEAYYTGSIPWATVRDMNVEVISETDFCITGEAVKNSSTNIIPAGNVVIATRVGLGKVCLLDRDTAINQDLRGLIPKRPGSLLPQYLFYWYKTVAPKVVSAGTGATVQGVKLEFVKSLQLPLPPLPEQKRIVAILDEAFTAIDKATANAEKNLQNARALFESHLNAVFNQRGEGACEKRLEDVCSFSSGGTPSKKNSSYWNGNIPWVSGRDMKSTRLSDTALHISEQAVEESSTRMAPAGALLTLVRGMGLAHGAQIAELIVPCAFNQDIRAIRPNRDIVPRYLLFALRTRIDSSDNVLSHAAHGTLKIDMDGLKKVEVPIPSPEHQQRVVLRIDMLSDETQRLQSIYQKKLTAVDDLKKSLLHQALSKAL